jgi:hypothetical protein
MDGLKNSGSIQKMNRKVLTQKTLSAKSTCGFMGVIKVLSSHFSCDPSPLMAI